MAKIESEELLREKDLVDVYRAARSISVSRRNQVVSSSVFLLALIFAALSPEKTHILADKVRAVADYGFGFATNILSFLIAGFTIYLSVTKTDLLLFLASERNDSSGLPEIKHIAFHFMRTMANFILYCLLCVGIKIFASSGGPLSMLIGTLADSSECVARVATVFGFALVSAATVHLLMLLHSFVFNIYHTAMITIVWEREKPK
ncbi:MAG: hypothetical protein IPH41_02345 [Sulfuritalea sp.]|jgi:hypothetical protein|nr:hypothetical protein [Rhodocyclaceae bacterium]MBK7022378.1 hypothetical protein [Sulfuritalea sp.]